MGATTFETYAWGRTPEEAFRAARESAAWEHGHGGYTGTIAEKHDFALFPLPPRLTARKLFDWAEDEGLDNLAYYRSEVPRCEAALAAAKPGTIRNARKRLTEAKTNLRRVEKESRKRLREIGTHAVLVERVHRVYDDKWGPAVCVEVTGVERTTLAARGWIGPQPKRGMKLYAFAGWASC